MPLRALGTATLPVRMFITLAVAVVLPLLCAGCAESDGAPAADVADAAGLAGPTPRDLPRGSGFDFYVLSLSWSPSYCEMEGADANREQCAPGRGLGFVVHGLWPQFENGYPQFCPTREPDRVPDSLGRPMLDLIPSMGLVGHVWRKHGSCSGLSQRDFFAVLRAARERIRIPGAFEDPATDTHRSPDGIEDAFVAVNPGLDRQGMAAICKGGRLQEVRICLTDRLEFRDCGEVDSAGCRTGSLRLPQPR